MLTPTARSVHCCWPIPTRTVEPAASRLVRRRTGLLRRRSGGLGGRSRGHDRLEARQRLDRDDGQLLAPARSGTVAGFTTRDMGMGGGMMGGPASRALGPMGFMPRAASVPSGQVTVVLRNAGTRPHELLVMPLAAGQSAGQRTVGSDDRISETGKVGEAQPVCPTDPGVDGTVPGGISQVTLTLAPGSYEIVCNLPGHYRAGMHATLTVS